MLNAAPASKRVLFVALAAGMQSSGCNANDQHEASIAPAKFESGTTSTDRAIRLTAGELVRVRDISGFALSPDGEHVAYAVRRADPKRNTYDVEWYVAPTMQNAEPVLVADGGGARLYVFPNGRMNGELAASEANWSPDGKWIAFAKTESGETQLWRARADGGGAEQITDNAADVEDFAWSDDGSLIFFSVGRDRGAVEQANAQDGLDGFLISDPMPPVASQGRPLWPKCVAQRSGSPMVTDKSRLCERRLWVADLAASVERQASKGERATRQEMVGQVKTAAEERVERILGGVGSGYGVQSPDERSVAWFENPDPEKYPGSPPPKRLVVTSDKDGKDKAVCLAEACTGFRLSEIWWTSDSQEVLFLASDGPGLATQSLYGWRPGDPDVRALFRNDEFRVRGCAQAGDRLICVREGWTRPDHIASVSLIDGSVDVIVDPNGEFQDFAFTKVEQLIYDDGKGVETYGHLVYPADYESGKRYPIVVVQYRTGGFLRGGTGDEQPIHVYAQNGMFVLSTNMPFNHVLYATQGGKELETSALLWEDERKNQRGLNAILQALNQLEKRDLINPRRIGITGLSSGASIVEQALVYTDRFAAASAAYANASPFAYYRIGSETSRKALYRGLHPFSKVGLAMWRERSSGLNPEKVNEPYLLQVADREYLMTLQNYIDLKDAGNPVELFVFPDEYHVKWRPAHRLVIYERNVDWMSFWLRGVENDDPEKSERYKRWRAMREEQCVQLKGADDRPWYCRQ